MLDNILSIIVGLYCQCYIWMILSVLLLNNNGSIIVRKYGQYYYWTTFSLNLLDNRNNYCYLWLYYCLHCLLMCRIISNIVHTFSPNTTQLACSIIVIIYHSYKIIGYNNYNSNHHMCAISQKIQSYFYVQVKYCISTACWLAKIRTRVIKQNNSVIYIQAREVWIQMATYLLCHYILVSLVCIVFLKWRERILKCFENVII